MAVESTPKHRPPIRDIRALLADAEAVAKRYHDLPTVDMAEVLDHARAIHVAMVLRWALGGYAPGGMPVGLEAIQDAARRIRQAAAPATEAEVFGGLTE